MPKATSEKHRRRRDKENIFENLDLPPTTGALGTERPTLKRNKQEDVGRSALDRMPAQNAPVSSNVLPAHSDAPKAPPENLAGVPDLQLRGWRGAKEVKQLHVRPWVNSNVNAESSIHFCLHTGAYEWVHVNRDAISLVMWTGQKNATYDAAAVYPQDDADVNRRGQPDLERRTEWKAVRAGDPALMIDPDVGARGFFSRIEVIVNDQLVPTNNCLGTLFTQYPRVMAMFANENSKRRKPHFKLLDDWSFPAGGVGMSDVMTEATKPFSMKRFNDDQGKRIPVPLDGIFPFDLKAAIHQSVEQMLPQVLFIAPSTKLEVKLYFLPTRMECLFHDQVKRDNYYDTTKAIGNPANLRITIQSAVMEYNSVELFPAIHTQLMSEYREKKMAYWNFDIPRGQHQPLQSGSSYIESTFQIYPYCRSLIIAFQPDHATFPQAHTKRPLSGWSTFPKGCTKLQVEYAGVSLGGPFINFGIRGINNELSMRQYYNYLDELHLADNISFEDLFPASETKQSLVQYLVFDVRHLMLDRMQLLRVAMEFAGQDLSPTGQQIAVYTIHPNGRANVKNESMVGCEWVWDFLQSS